MSAKLTIALEEVAVAMEAAAKAYDFAAEALAEDRMHRLYQEPDNQTEAWNDMRSNADRCRHLRRNALNGIKRIRELGGKL